MSAEPALDHQPLLDTLREAYGLDLDALRFLPYGTMPAYRAEGPAGRFFVKLFPDTPFGRSAAVRAAAEVPLLHALRQGHRLSRIPRPRATLAGADLAQVQGHALVVHEWIEASPLGHDWTAALHDLAPLLGTLHAEAPQISARVSRWPMPPEDFALPFERQLTEDLAWLGTGTPGARPGLQALRDLVLPHADAVRELLIQARAVQATARAHARSSVLCHTDAHGGNVLRDRDGQLWIIDWETARLAPPEHDLWMFGERLPEVLPAYAAALGRPARPDPDLLGFYIYRRALEDLAVDMELIVRENTRQEQDEVNLMVIERFALPAVMQATQAQTRLRAALGAGGRSP